MTSTDAELDQLDADVRDVIFGGHDRSDTAYSRTMAGAWQVHQAVCAAAFSTRQRYFRHLQDQARTGKGHQVAWPDVLVVLRDRMPEAICRAAVLAMSQRLRSRSTGSAAKRLPAKALSRRLNNK